MTDSMVGWTSFAAFIALYVAADEYEHDFPGRFGAIRGVAAPALAFLFGAISAWGLWIR
jgi:hypothetical protein